MASNLQTIVDVRTTLFPPTVKRGRYAIMYDADENLNAAIYDLERLGASTSCLRTLRKVLKQLIQARRILGAARVGASSTVRP